MVRRIKVGLCGLGSLAQRGLLPHLACADAQERVATVACCDSAPGRAELVAGRYGWLEAYSDYAEMLRRADIEAVLLTTPIPLHYPQTMAAIAAGKHVYVQKPLATALAEADAIVEAAGRAGVTVVAAPGQMLRPLNQHLRRLIADGTIGKVYWALGSSAAGAHEQEAVRSGGVLGDLDPSWYYRPGGGPVYDVTVYALQALTGILGPACGVAAMSGIGMPQRRWRDRVIDVEVDDNTLMLLDFGQSTFAVAGGQALVATPGIGSGRLAFFGTEGTIDVYFDAESNADQGGELAGVEIVAPKRLGGTLGFSGGTFLPQPDSELPHVVGPHRVIEEGQAYADVMHLMDCLVERRPPIANLGHARHIVEIIEAAYRSARGGQTQRLRTDFTLPI